MIHIFNSNPEGISETVMSKWESLPRYNITKTLHKFNSNKIIQKKKFSESGGKQIDYFGQISIDNLKEGHGRQCYEKGSIQEGIFKND